MIATCRSRNSAEGARAVPAGRLIGRLILAGVLLARSPVLMIAQASGPAGPAGSPPAAGDAADLTDRYIIGPGDVLSVRFWRQDDVSADVVVRPDGRITLLLLDDIQAAGLTPEQLRDRIAEAAGQFFEDPDVTVIVREINSRNVYITGMVAKPGPYPLRGPLTVLQLISMAGGLLEYAKKDRIVIISHQEGQQTRTRFNYETVTENNGSLYTNVELKPGDTVVVP